METLVELMAQIKSQKRRVLLTSFGVFWGMFLLVVLMGFGKGLKNGVDSQFAGTGNTVYLWRNAVTQKPYKGYSAGRWVGLNDEDLAAINQQVAGVDIAVGINEVGGWSKPQYVAYKTISSDFVIQGSHPEVKSMNGYEVTDGRFINQVDNDEKRKVAVIGHRVYQTLFGKEDAIGKVINVAGLRFKVVGVFSPLSTGPQSSIDGELVLIPNNTLRLSFDQMDYINLIRMTPLPGYHASEIEDDAVALLKKRWSIHPDDHGVYGSYNTQFEYDKLMSLFKGIAIFSWFVAMGTIISGVVGVGNIMLISIKERTQEIGLRRSIGATVKSIVSMVVQETLLIVFVSGYLGLIVGINFLSIVANHLAVVTPESAVFRNPGIDYSIVFAALFALVLGGLLSALYPSFKATRISPVEALKD